MNTDPPGTGTNGDVDAAEMDRDELLAAVNALNTDLRQLTDASLEAQALIPALGTVNRALTDMPALSGAPDWTSRVHIRDRLDIDPDEAVRLLRRVRAMLDNLVGTYNREIERVQDDLLRLLAADEDDENPDEHTTPSRHISLVVVSPGATPHEAAVLLLNSNSTACPGAPPHTDAAHTLPTAVIDPEPHQPVNYHSGIAEQILTALGTSTGITAKVENVALVGTAPLPDGHTTYGAVVWTDRRPVRGGRWVEIRDLATTDMAPGQFGIAYPAALHIAEQHEPGEE